MMMAVWASVGVQRCTVVWAAAMVCMCMRWMAPLTRLLVLVQMSRVMTMTTVVRLVMRSVVEFISP